MDFSQQALQTKGKFFFILFESLAKKRKLVKRIASGDFDQGAMCYISMDRSPQALKMIESFF